MGLLRRQDAPPEGESFASGNIAQVLRQARASLKDPSRPFTPTERRLRSTKSLFGEAGFRPDNTDNRTTSSAESRKKTRGPLSRNVLDPDHVERLKKKQAGREFGNIRRRKLVAPPPPRSLGATTSDCSFEIESMGDSSYHHHGGPESFTPEGAVFRPSASWDWTGGTGGPGGIVGRHGLEHSMKDVAHHERSSDEPPACPRTPSSLSARPSDLGILYLDEGCPRGSKSRSIVKKWGSSSSSGRRRRRRRRRRSSSTDSSSSSGSSGSINKENRNTSEEPLLGAVGTTKSIPPNKEESREYEGLYGSDDDVDTTAWDLGSVCSGISDDGCGVEDEPPTAAGPDCASPGEDGSRECLDLDFILDAIENEVDLSGSKGSGFGDDDDDDDDGGDGVADNSKLGLRGKSTVNDDDSSSDASPDPGTLEGQRDRNTRLAGLLQMLSRHLDSVMRNTTSSNRASTVRKGDRYPGAWSSHGNPDNDERTGGSSSSNNKCNNNRSISTLCTARVFEVLSGVLDRPRGLADASPPGITELPTLSAAQVIVSLVMPSLLLSTSASLCSSSAEDDGSEADDRSTPSAGNETANSHNEQQQQQQQQRLLMKSCRHLFEVSKKAGADKAFFSTGAVTTLLHLVECAASGFDSIPGATAHDGDGRRGGRGRRRRRRRRELRVEVSGQSTDVVDMAISNTNSHHVGNDSDDGISGDAADDFGGSGEDIGSVCNSLTFAVGCLKNVSAVEDLRDRLVQAGSIRKLCRLVRSMRELCRRYDATHKQRATRASHRGRIDHNYEEEAQFSNNSLFDDVGEGGRRGMDQDSLVRRRVSPLLAQAINLLRDLAIGGKDRSDRFHAAGTVRTLCSILGPFRDHQDVVLNAARALAKLSLQEKTRGEINSDPAHARDLLAALIEQGRKIDGDFRNLEESYRNLCSSSSSSLSGAPTGAVAAAVPADGRRLHWEKQGKCVAACVRIAFALGNLTSGSDENRRFIGIQLGGADSLPLLVQTSSRAHLAAWESLRRSAETNPFAFADGSAERGGGGGTWGDASSRASFLRECWAKTTLKRACDGLEEMLVKTVRLLANISIHREVGQWVCLHPGLVTLEPLVGKCLELFGLFEDGALPQADPRVQPSGRCRSRNGVRHSPTGPREQVPIPGEELLLNAVSLVTNLSFYGPGANSPATASSGRVSPNTHNITADLPDSSSGGAGSSCNGGDNNTKCHTSVTAAAGPPQVSTLFVLASKARRSFDEHEESSTCPVTPTAGIIGHDNSHEEGKQTRMRNNDDDNNNSYNSGKVVVGTPLTTETVASPQTCPRPPSTNSTGGGGCDVLCGQLVKVLLYPNAEAVAEAARAFGNFSRDPSCREAMAKRRADEVLVALLGHPCRDVVFAAAGALVNVAADPAFKARLSRESVGTGERLARLVRRAGLADPGLAELACQALHNLLIEPLPAGGVEEILGGPETHKKLWWTLKELMGACERPEVENGRGGGRSGAAWAVEDVAAVADQGGEGGESSELAGFPAAAGAIWKALNEGRVDCEEACFENGKSMMV